MALSMLEYGKIILRKVSFDKDLFYKEYQKLCRELRTDECRKLNYWLLENLNEDHLSHVPIRSNN